jgi:glycine/D-amino acid oxidase-like deaminating enzyme
MNRRGYLFATADRDQVPEFLRRAQEAASLGVGSARVHASPGSDYEPAPADGFDDQPTGADVITDQALIRRHFPYLSKATVALLHARRCGWFSGQQLGMYLLERARDKGVRLLEGRVEAVDTTGGRVRSARIATRGGEQTIATPCFVNAAGPFAKDVGRRLGVDLPLFCERHGKFSFNDTRGAVPRHAPLMIWTDPVRLPWSEEERRDLEQSPEHRHLLREFTAGVHGRPEGGSSSPVVLLIWTYDVEPTAPVFPLTFDAALPEILIRGMSRIVPALSVYFSQLPRGVVDGGYYTKTQENRLLASPMPVAGAYVIAGLSGYGLMSSNGAADLVADHITGRPLPAYASAFRLDRYDDPAYRALLAEWGDSGQL